MTQHLIVGVVFVAAVFYLVRHVLQLLTTHKGCGHCNDRCTKEISN